MISLFFFSIIFFTLIINIFSKKHKPSTLGLKRDDNSQVELKKQIKLNGGVYYMGSELHYKNKIRPLNSLDGAHQKKKVKVDPFYIDEDCVTNREFQDFVKATGYKTEAEKYKWSFVFEKLASEEVIKKTDSKEGMGRVKDSLHWLGVKGASWKHPYGPDSDIESILDYPVVHISYLDAREYCKWAGRRLLTEKEWEYAARAGTTNQRFPWSDIDGIPLTERINYWQGKFPKENLLEDGYLGLAPVYSYEPNNFGIYNMIGNVWEWVSGGKNSTKTIKVLRGGSFLDSESGQFNHYLSVSTRQTISSDSTAVNIGFRCGNSVNECKNKDENGDCLDKLKEL